MKTQTTFVEGTGTYPSRFFFHLWEKKDSVVFFGSAIRDSNTFGKNIVIVRKMISGSPLMESDGIFYAHLEKIIVDLYCDWNKIYPYKKPTFYLFLKKLNKDYSINENKLLRYADRRKKKQVFIKFLDRLKK